jgi:hypothetical protein
MTDKDARDRYDNSFRDKSMSSDRSRDSWLREGPTERIGPSRNRDPRDRDEQRNRSYSSLQRAPSPTRGRGAKGKGVRAPSTASHFPKFCNVPIEILTRANALRHLGIEKPLPPPTEAEALGISNYDLADLLRKTSLGQYDRANHQIICGQLREMYIDASIGIEMSYENGQPTVWLDLCGQTIPPEKVEEIPYKYYMPPVKDQAILGNYWWVVRIRPQSGTKKYEYMINKTYAYSRLAWDFAQVRYLTLSANRWYYEGPIEKTVSSCLYPYHQYCPGLDIDFRRCNINLQLNRLQYIEETKEPPNPRTPNASAQLDGKTRNVNPMIQSSF